LPGLSANIVVGHDWKESGRIVTVAATRNLVMVHSPGKQALSDWVTVRERIRALAPDIDVRIASNAAPDAEISLWQAARPSLVFSPVPLVRYASSGGKLYAGREESKLDQVKRLSAAGLPVPEGFGLLPWMPLKRDNWGDYVIVKPTMGKVGDFVRLVRTEEVGARYLELTNNQTTPMLVQKFIDHTDETNRLVQYRVLTLFAQPLYSVWRRSVEPRPSLAELADRRSAHVASNYRGVDREFKLVKDEEVLSLATRVGEACPEFPVLGIDIIRERSTGKLYVLETNSGGHVWHFSSDPMPSPAARERMYRQFGALDLAAELLIDKTRREAR
jgi:hypothetical protein